MADWAEHLLWFEDGRFANHQYFKFVVHNMIMRKRAIENSTFIVKQKLGDAHLSVSDIRDKIQNDDNSIIKKIIYLSSNLRGSSKYWDQKAKELRSLVQYNINEGCGLPSSFCTGSCAISSP
jgi:thiamine kinase-like enzyme